MTAAEYYALVATFDHDRTERLAALIPLNINRAGKHYKKLLTQYETTITKRL